MNHIIDIDGICKIVRALLQDYEVEVRIIGLGESTEKFIKSLEKLGASVIYYGPIYEDKEKYELLKNCDFALNMMKGSVKVGLTTKSIDYISFGLPIINNIKGDTRAIVKDLRMGINYNGDDKLFMKDVHKKEAFTSEWIHNQYQQIFSKVAFMEKLRRGLQDV